MKTLRDVILGAALVWVVVLALLVVELWPYVWLALRVVGWLLLP